MAAHGSALAKRSSAVAIVPATAAKRVAIGRPAIRARPRVQLEAYAADMGRPDAILRGAGIFVRNLSASAAIESGFQAAAVQRFAEALSLPSAELATILGVSPKTIARKVSARESFAGVSSDRAYRLFYVTARAVHAFGDVPPARRWLFREIPSLDGRRPIELIRTEIGTQEVLSALDRIEFGGVA